jgi:hypothetical protein
MATEPQHTHIHTHIHAHTSHSAWVGKIIRQKKIRTWRHPYIIFNAEPGGDASGKGVDGSVLFLLISSDDLRDLLDGFFLRFFFFFRSRFCFIDWIGVVYVLWFAVAFLGSCKWWKRWISSVPAVLLRFAQVREFDAPN